MFIEQLINGLTIGGMYALVAIGYTMVFGVLELINFAHGSVYMLGSYITLILFMNVIDNFWLAFACGIVLTGIVGYSIDFIGLRRLRAKNAPKIAALISTLGISTIIEQAVQITCGSDAKPYPQPISLESVHIFGVAIRWNKIIILITAIILMTILSLFVYRTKYGKGMQAVAQDGEASQLMGVPVKTIITMTFMLGSALAAIAGTLAGTYYQTVDTGMGFFVGMTGLASAVLGGIGSIPGAMIGGIMFGVIETLGAVYISSGYRNAISFIVIIFIILIKPNGLFGKMKIDKV